MSILDFEDTVNKVKAFLPDYLRSKNIDPTQNFQCIFPGHEDTKPSCNVVGIDTPTPRVHCYSCGRTGDIFDVVQILENKPKLGLEWVEETLKYLAEMFGVEIAAKDLTEEQIYELDTYRAYRAAAELIISSKLDPVKHARVIEHIAFRGWKESTLEESGVGTVSSYSEFRQTLKDSGFTARFLDEIDLGRNDIFNEKNLIFTWRDEKGRPIGFTSRNLAYEEEIESAKESGKKCSSHKYNNQRTTGLKCNIFQKGKRFYGIDEGIKHAPPLYIFEGQTDVITARNAGISNCVAIAGNSLNTDHILLLKDLGLYDIILCLDGDAGGQDKLTGILEKFKGYREMKVRVATLPDKEDPDSFIRTQKLHEFQHLAKWSAFEWRLNQFSEDDDPTKTCEQMVPYIVNEPSAIVRDQYCKELSLYTGVAYKAIIDELSSILDEKVKLRSRERQNVLDRAVYELSRSPTEAELILDKTRVSLGELSRKYNSDVLSAEDFVRYLDIQKEDEEAERNNDTGFHLGSDLEDLEEVLRGEWSKDVFMCLGGKPNTGKSSLLSKLAHAIATNNDDTCVIYHTIDDTIAQLVPRFVTIADGSTKLTMNMVRQPNYWTSQQGLDFITKRREYGYQKIRDLAVNGRLIIKDVSHGMSLPFAENLISYYQDKYPDRKIVYILDNAHKLRDFEGKDERVRFKTISESCKNIALRKHIAFISSVEYTKLPPGVKPTNYNIAESAQIEYDANFIAHLYNDVADTPEAFTVCHQDLDWKGEEVFLPRIEVIIGKNKITEQKRSLFLDFWPAASDFRKVVHRDVIDGVREMKSKRSRGSEEVLNCYE